ncbi:MAG: sulfatase-like hydrolase/transferase [Parafilimonas sp.]
MLFSLVIFTTRTEAQAQKPNIIFILGDDVGYKALTVNGGNLFSTPAIDSLSHNGMRFTQCYSSPLCSPSRFLLLTGKYNFRNYYKWGLMDTTDRTMGNLFKDAGYKTGCFGKWQFGGGDPSIHALGFDEYTVHDALGPSQIGSRYKNPDIYTHGNFLPNSKTKDKYGPDIISDSLLKFIEENKSAPFFVYYPMILTHGPFSPTPDDTVAFANWHFGNDTSFFPSMVKYMDKEIGKLMAKLQELGIDKNTVIIYSGDNGSPKKIEEYNDDGEGESGGKAKTTSTGTHVPLIVYWPGKITPGTVNNDLIDFTDFLPTFAGIADISIPKTWIEDGVDFSTRLTGGAGTPRSWIFDYFNHDPSIFISNDTTRRFAQTAKYKLYDTSAANSKRLFYNIIKDTEEVNPIPDNLLTAQEKDIQDQLLSVINGYVLQGFAVMADPVLQPLTITDSSITISDSIKIDGGSTITSTGVVWDTKQNPVLSNNNYTLDIPYRNRFSSDISNLDANTTYYVRTYATNKAGTAYSNQISFTTFQKAPKATQATDIEFTKFTAHWIAVPDAQNYRIDVSTSPYFSNTTKNSLIEGFNKGINPPDGWVFKGGLSGNNFAFGKSAPSIEFKAKNSSITTKILPAFANSLSFWMRSLTGNNFSFLLVEGFDGFEWRVVDNINNIPVSPKIKTYNFTAFPGSKNNFIQFKFTYFKDGGNIVIDDIDIDYPTVKNLFVKSYQDTLVNADSLKVTDIKKDTQYYYRVRAEYATGTSVNSNTIAVRPVTDSSDDPALQINVFPNPSSNEFFLKVQTASDKIIDLLIYDLQGNKIYQTSGNVNEQFTFGRNFAPGTYFVRVIQGNTKKTAKIIKAGR